jgi:hypothetical protein
MKEEGRGKTELWHKLDEEILYQINEIQFAIKRQRRTQEGGGGCRAAAPPQNPQNRNLKDRFFFRYYKYDIRSFTLFTLQTKSATEISWWLVH